MSLVKYRLKEVAADFGVAPKEIAEIVAKVSEKPKSNTQVLTEEELNVVFDYMTQHNQISSLEEVFAVQPKPKAEAAPKKPSKTNHTSAGFRPDAVVFAGYQHDFMSPYARFSVRNTTDKTITSFTFRIQYYNMKGSMIDFEETTYDMILKPGKAYTINIPGYKYESNYVYRSSANAHEGIPYQVDFELLSIVVKN